MIPTLGSIGCTGFSFREWYQNLEQNIWMKPNGTRQARADVGKQSYCTEMAWFFERLDYGRYVEVIFKSLTFQLFPYNDGAELSGVVSPVGSEDEVDTDEDDRLSGLPLLLIAGGIVGVLLVGFFCVLMICRILFA
ncbi:hypothetical protein Fcan01_17336 [Folsomia candida]|uniref:Uncharacterized protein n=1 Tax=Folsomia candida TaxID=158441 RepID=A0A226DTJ4_FOLCA|nr:hypothetical protein Fcan01_17336 [Folsomia candida]